MNLAEIGRKIRRREPRLRTEGVELVSAVLVPLVRREGGFRLIFEIRNRRLKRQPGEICFPGGAIEPHDGSPRAAAVRECCEELGISPVQIDVLGGLDPFVSGSHVLLYPFLGCLDHEAVLDPDGREIESLLEIPLRFFLDSEPEVHPVEVRLRPLAGFPMDRVPKRYRDEWGRKRLDVYFYQYGPHTIWGLSARILVDLVERLRG